MKAVLCKSYGPAENLVLEEVDAPTPGDNEVIIEVHAAGLNFPDVLMIQGKYQSQPPFPFSPGGELAGKVISVGSGVSKTKVGDRVMALVGSGSFSQQVAVNENRLMAVPDSMNYKQAAGFSMTYGTSYHALKQRGQLKAGETLLVLGASGGVGLSAVEIGKAMGATVIAAASSDDKLAVAKKAGADHLINYSDGNFKDQVKELTGGKGADVIYDPVGDKYTEQCLRCINWNGRLLIIGFAAGDIPKLPANLALLKGCSIVGVFWGSFTAREAELNQQNFSEMFALQAQGVLDPLVSMSFPMAGYVEALNTLSQRKAVGKVILLPQE